jgi:hypothetical protein
VFGVTIGNVFMLQALLVGECFGMRSFATVLGLLQLDHADGEQARPFALGLLHEALGSYARGLLPLVALAGVGAALVLRVRPPSPESAWRRRRRGAAVACSAR